MCEPTTIAMIALGASAATQAAGAVMQHAQTASTARAQEANTRAGAALDLSQLNAQQTQINEQNTQQVSERARQAMIERGHLIAAAADSGAEGSNFNRLLGETQLNESADMATLETNRRNAQQQNQMQKQGTLIHAQSALNQIRQPSLIGTGLKLLDAGLGAYGASSGFKSTPTSGYGMGNRSA